jgi:hypothetical protein
MFTRLRAVTARALIAAVASIVAGAAALPAAGAASAADPIEATLSCVRARRLQAPSLPVRGGPSVARSGGQLVQRGELVPGAKPCSHMGDGIYVGLPGAALATNMGFDDAAYIDLPANP